jgi:hypothetical protein
MAKKDEILQSFLTHKLLETKYGLGREDIPKTVREALNSKIPIVKAIALIVEGLNGHTTVTDSALRTQVIQFLNDAI